MSTETIYCMIRDCTEVSYGAHVKDIGPFCHSHWVALHAQTDASEANMRALSFENARLKTRLALHARAWRRPSIQA